MRLMWFVGLVLGVACSDATGPREFTLGPGCWGVKVFYQTLDDGRIVKTTFTGHWAICPDPMPDGYVFSHWDTTYAP